MLTIDVYPKSQVHGVNMPDQGVVDGGGEMVRMDYEADKGMDGARPKAQCVSLVDPLLLALLLPAPPPPTSRTSTSDLNVTFSDPYH